MNCRGVGTEWTWSRFLIAVGLLMTMAAALLLLPFHFSTPASSQSVLVPAPLLQPHPAGTPPVRLAFAHLPLGFEANQGQSDPRVKFLAHGSGYGLFLTEEEAVLVLQSSSRNGSILRMRLAGADESAPFDGKDELAGKSNYFIGNNPAAWHRDVPRFARVRYQHVYPGIDLQYYGNQGRLEYDFEIAPGADPRRISLKFEGSQKHQLDAQGNLVLSTPGGEVRFESPKLYQEVGQQRHAVPGRFVQRENGVVGFEVGSYDHSRTLVIDPVLSYSTYLGGSGAESCSAITGAAFTPGCPAIAIDSALNIYVAGATTSTVNFPNPSGVATSNTVSGPADVFVTKLINSGSTQAFITYLGGSGTDTPAGIGVDSGFDVTVAGTTDSTDFPTVKGYQSAPASNGNKHVFVTQVGSAGVVTYSTYLSGNGTDIATGVALDASGKIYVTGTTTSTETPSGTVVFPATVGAFQTKSLATTQFFMTKVDPSTSATASVPYSTYFGGGNPANGVAIGGGITVDQNNPPNVYITGGTNFLDTQASPQSTGGNDFPILNAAQACLDVPTATTTNNIVSCPVTPPTATDAFIAKFNPEAATGAQLLYSTYVGGTGADVGYGIAVDTGGSAYITGSTTSTDFPAGVGTVAFQPCPNDPNLVPTSCATSSGATDAFVAKISNFTPPVAGASSVSVSLIYFSYLGGSGADAGTAIAVDTVGGARVTGWTDSSDFPTQNSVQSATGGGRDAFVANLNTIGNSVCTPNPTANPPVVCPSYSSYLGGSGTDMGTGIALDAQGSTYVVGETTSGNFPVTNPFQGTFAGVSDAFVSKLSPALNMVMTATASPSPVGVGNSVTYKYTIVNNGDAANGVTFTDNLPTASAATFVSATASPGSCGAVNGTTVQCNLGSVTTTPSGSTGPTVTVLLTPVAPTTPSTTPLPNLGNSATISVPGLSFQASASATAVVNDFTLNPPPAPASETVASGQLASYSVQVTPTGPIPDTVSLSVSSTLPTGATASFTTPSFSNLNNGPQSSTLNIQTTQRVTTTTEMRRSGRPFYALLLPFSGLALFSMAGRKKMRRTWIMGLFAVAFAISLGFSASCGTTPPTSTTTGTPAGTYTVIISATSGSAVRTATVVLVVQ